MQRPEITEALLYFLQEIACNADELYLLGDIFEAWIGDDYADPVLEQIAPAFSALAAKGTKIYFIHGNRDFLVGEAGAARLGATLLPEQQVIELPQGPALLMHGDELCLDDEAYLEFRQMVRDSEWQQSFLQKPLEERLAIAKHLRETSKAAGAMKSEEIMDVAERAVNAAFISTGAAVLIHGHTHRPARHQEPSGERIVLGDWDSQGWYLRSDTHSLELVQFTPNPR